MKKIDFEVFDPGQYLYFDIGRLIQVENITGKSAGDIIRNQELNLGILTALLSIGLRQHGIKNPQWYATKMQELIDQGHEMEEFVQPVVKAKEVYYAIFPEEDPGKDQAKGKTKPKN